MGTQIAVSGVGAAALCAKLAKLQGASWHHRNPRHLAEHQASLPPNHVLFCFFGLRSQPETYNALRIILTIIVVAHHLAH